MISSPSAKVLSFRLLAELRACTVPDLMSCASPGSMAFLSSCWSMPRIVALISCRDRSMCIELSLGGIHPRALFVSPLEYLAFSKSRAGNHMLTKLQGLPTAIFHPPLEAGYCIKKGYLCLSDLCCGFPGIRLSHAHAGTLVGICPSALPNSLSVCLLLKFSQGCLSACNVSCYVNFVSKYCVS
jgi:hypothetical protein